ncbi:MAG: alginate export family protein [Pseudomonadota bacterium]
MRQFVKVLLVSTSVCAAAPVLAEEPLGPIEIGDEVYIDPILDMRLRVETADQSSFPDAASSVTLRTRAGADLNWSKFSFIIEAEGTVALDDNYNDTIPSNGIEPFPVIADPDSFDLNRLQFGYKGDNGSITVGRQRVILDDARFVGNVGWRQNEQTFDAVRGTAKIGPVALDATYSISQRTIFGSESPIGSFDGDFVFLNGKADLGPVKALGYSYTIDYEDRTAFSSQTFGGELKGSIPAGPFKVGLRAGFATQSDTGDNPIDYSAEYIVGEASVAANGWTVRLQYEELGSDGGFAAFQTPLATAHKFNGFADLFLVTPATGLRDTNIRVGKKFTIPGLTTFNTFVAFHQFDSDFGGVDYGTEIDAVVSFKAGPVGILAKLGDYRADDFGVDTTRFTLQAGISF